MVQAARVHARFRVMFDRSGTHQLQHPLLSTYCSPTTAPTDTSKILYPLAYLLDQRKGDLEKELLPLRLAEDRPVAHGDGEESIHRAVSQLQSKHTARKRGGGKYAEGKITLSK